MCPDSMSDNYPKVIEVYCAERVPCLRYLIANAALLAAGLAGMLLFAFVVFAG